MKNETNNKDAVIDRLLFLNQMAGPLFRELAEDLSANFLKRSELYTGHPDTLKFIDKIETLKITKSPIYNRKSKITRILSWLKYTWFAFFKIIFASKGTLVFVVSNPPLIGPLALIVGKIRRLPYVVLIYDMHPDTMISFGVLREDSVSVRFWRFINKHVWEGASAVYTIGDVMAEKLAKQFDVEKTKQKYVGVVPPWADTENIKPIEKTLNPLANEYGQLGFTTVLYSGNMGISHDIESILKAAKLLKHREDIKFLFFGEGEKWQSAYDFVEVEGLTNVQVLPFQPEARLPYTMSLGDISLVALDKGAEGLMVPSKMYYYMAAGSAIIGICQGRNDLSESLYKGDSGLIVLPGDYEKLTENIIYLVDNPNILQNFKNNARASSIAHFSRQVCMKKLQTYLLSITLTTGR
ncbi:glycosyltransferase family 4 protein [Amylibacter sp.]|nr:glycosyltransferase family 4 protein [Amylibacter sp.]